MRRMAAAVIGLLLGLFPSPAVGGSAWGSPGYGDPPGWCTNHSDMWTATIVTNDPSVGTNPERDTFYGFHRNPGYDDWYGYFYGDFRGRPGDSSGWTKLLHEDYPNHYHWNFADNGWAVHGHAKQYIAYYNWTFGGECGLGRNRNGSPPPFMADQYGYPVVDIYVDSVPPQSPRPRVARVSTSSVDFTWDPVVDVGDGAGADYFVAGMDHYLSWVTLNGGSQRLQLASSYYPVTVTQTHMSPVDVACVHVQAFDRVQNESPEQVACSRALAAPPMPPWDELAAQVRANPSRIGLVGLDTWFWLDPMPHAITVHENDAGIDYAITATPVSVAWQFGDGARADMAGPSGYGRPYPQQSSVTHVYEAHSQDGYPVQASIRYAVSWTALIAGQTVGPYPMGTFVETATGLLYPVEQAQPELLRI
ncbi:MAG TPA: hypothetical protein VG426_00995 [Candidatus Dormibacteraeota bacterium]|nr:hypothetical protein [Candidatus Dormibacteraeota bacterium]